jgi:hypothetical protein
VTELLLPMLPVGLLLWAKAITGVARRAAASMEILSVEDIDSSLFGYGITAKPGYSHRWCLNCVEIVAIWQVF